MRDITKCMGNPIFKKMVIFFQFLQVLELMDHPIGPKFGHYIQLIDMKGNSEQIFEIFIFG